MQQHQISNIKDIKTFVLAGNAYFTLRNTQTMNRFTFCFAKPKKHRKAPPPNCPTFVSVLGSDDIRGYSFAGTIWVDGDNVTYRHSPKSKIAHGERSMFVIPWFINYLNANKELPQQVEMWHEGRCGRCARQLTVPESIASGIGPICESMKGTSLI